MMFNNNVGPWQPSAVGEQVMMRAPNESAAHVFDQFSPWEFD
jgi:hypothetical protein